MLGFVALVSLGQSFGVLGSIEKAGTYPVHLTAITTRVSGTVNGADPVSIRLTDLYWRSSSDFLLVGRQIRRQPASGSLVTAAWVEKGEVHFYQALKADRPEGFDIVEDKVPLAEFLKGGYGKDTRTSVFAGGEDAFALVPVRVRVLGENWAEGAKPVEGAPNSFQLASNDAVRGGVMQSSVTLDFKRFQVERQVYLLQTGSIIGHYRQTATEFSYAPLPSKKALVFARPSKEELRALAKAAFPAD